MRGEAVVLRTSVHRERGVRVSNRLWRKPSRGTVVGEVAVAGTVYSRPGHVCQFGGSVARPDGVGDVESLTGKSRTTSGGRSAHQASTASGRPSTSTVRPVMPFVSGVHEVNPTSMSTAEANRAIVRRVVCV